MTLAPEHPGGGDLPAKALTYTAWAALLAAVLTPIRQNWRRHPRDGFPLSYYPMFSARRRRTGTVVHLVGVDGSGQDRILHYRHAGSGGLNQVRRQVRRSVKSGHAQALADRAAASLALSRKASEAEIAEVRVVSSVHAYDAFFTGRREPERQVVHATATVHREGR